MSARKPKLPKPSKALLAQLEAEGFIEEPEGPKPPLPKPISMKLPKGKTVAEIIAEQRR